MLGIHIYLFIKLSSIVLVNMTHRPQGQELPQWDYENPLPAALYNPRENEIKVSGMAHL